MKGLALSSEESGNFGRIVLFSMKYHIFSALTPKQINIRYLVLLIINYYK